MSRALAVIAAVTTLAVAVGVGEMTDTVYVYGDSATSLNQGLVVGNPTLCVGFEWRGVLGFFDCRDGGV